MLVYVFPGQGSQRRGMGEGLFDRVPEFLEIEQQVDALLGYSLRQLCLDDPQRLLNQTRYTQPALFAVNALHYFDAQRQASQAGAVAGHSLGEYNALLAAGTFDLYTGFTLVKRRGELMSQASGGAMAAVLGLDAAKILAALERRSIETVDIANYNAPSQTVISGPASDVKNAVAVLDKEGAQMCVPLQVSAAFHSRQMHEPAVEFGVFLEGIEFRSPRMPVIANITGRPYPAGVAAAEIRQLLVRQFCEPVRWRETVGWLQLNGATEFRELGPGQVLTRLINQCRLAT